MKRPNVADPAPAAPPSGGPPARKPPEPVTPQWLERAALHYLERYSASAQMLARTLARRVERRARSRGEEPADFAELVEATVARTLGAGLVDDARFAQARLATLRRRGASARGAAAKLTAKGVPRDVVAAAMAAEVDGTAGAEGDPGIEEAAARALARRRRLGPHRPAEARAAHRERDLAVLARAGFSYGLARAVIDEDTG